MKFLLVFMALFSASAFANTGSSASSEGMSDYTCSASVTGMDAYDYNLTIKAPSAKVAIASVQAALAMQRLNQGLSGDATDLTVTCTKGKIASSAAQNGSPAH
jgi:hypothetical protein